MGKVWNSSGRPAMGYGSSDSSFIITFNFLRGGLLTINGSVPSITSWLSWYPVLDSCVVSVRLLIFLSFTFYCSFSQTERFLREFWSSFGVFSPDYCQSYCCLNLHLSSEVSFSFYQSSCAFLMKWAQNHPYRLRLYLFFTNSFS